MEALSLEPWKVWNTYFAPSLQLWELPTRTLGAYSLGLAPSRAAWRRPPALPGQTNLCVQPARSSISRTAGDKALRPAGWAHGLSSRRLTGLRVLGMLLISGGQRVFPGASSTPISLGCAGIPAPVHSRCFCCRLPELVTFRSLERKAWRMEVLGRVWTMASYPQLSPANSPFGSVNARTQKQLRRFGLPSAGTPGPLWRWEREGDRRRLLGISRIEGGLRRVANARSTYGCASQTGEPRSAPLGSPPSPRPVRAPPLLAGREGH